MPRPIDCDLLLAPRSGRPTPDCSDHSGTNLSMLRARSKSSPKSADGGAVHDVDLAPPLVEKPATEARWAATSAVDRLGLLMEGREIPLPATPQACELVNGYQSTNNGFRSRLVWRWLSVYRKARSYTSHASKTIQRGRMCANTK